MNVMNLRRKKITAMGMLLLCMFLSGCAGLADYHVPLSGGYELWRGNAYRIEICKVEPDNQNLGTVIVDAYVSYVAFDNEFIFSQVLDVDKTQSPPIDLDAEPDFFIIDTAREECTGPLTLAEFHAWCDSTGHTFPEEWIRSTDVDGLTNHAKAVS